MCIDRFFRQFTVLPRILLAVTLGQIPSGAAASEIFSDGFETGDTSRWSSVVGLAGSAELHGFVWDDWITNGEQDFGSEGVLRGWTVYLDENSNGTFDPSTEIFATVDTFGTYSMTGVPSGSHDVRLDLPDGWTLSTPGAGSYSITLADDEVLGELDFAARRRSDTWDYGDAPDPTYPTFFQRGGPAHLIASGLRLGAGLDAEGNGQPGAGANGDGADEDGVAFPWILVRGQTTYVNVTASGVGILNVWVDLGRDGFFAQAVDHVIDDLPLVAGVNGIGFGVPKNAGFGETYARFRFSSVGGIGPGGDASDGEVEDYLITIQPEHSTDFGDAPDTGYMTYGGSGGPYHTLMVDYFLGDNVDGEVDGQPHIESTGDDLGWFDDEDGVDFTSHLVPGDTAEVTIEASASGYVDAWIDFDESIDWGPTDQILSAVPVVRGPNFFTISVPGSSSDGDKVSRFRMSNQGGVGPGGPLDRGEVEDYGIEVEYLDWGDAPDIDEGPFISKLNALDAAPGDVFGASVDVDGDWAIVGSWFDGDGSSTLFHWTGADWVEDQELTRGGAMRYGYDVGIEGTRALVGQYGSSKAYYYEYDGLDWNYKQELTADDSGPSDNLGKAVGLSGNFTILGAADHEQSGLRIGAAYIFEHNGAIWNQTAKLMAPDGDHGDNFGWSVTIDGDLAAVGSPGDDDPRETGSVFVYERSGSNWLFEQELRASSATEGLFFGSSVSIDGDRMVIGSRTQTFVFHRDGGGNWSEMQTMSGGGFINRTSDISGDWIVTGSYGDDTGGLDAGAARLYRWNGNQWSLWKKIFALDPDHGHEFGEAVAIDGMRSVIGGRGANSGEIDHTGAAYIFDWLIDEDHYPTLDVNNGAYHTAHPSFRLGTEGLDIEGDGHPHPTAQGDDIIGLDDESGIVFTSAVMVGHTATLDVIATAPGLLDAWVDFNNDGDWDDQDEQVFSNEALIAGLNSLGFEVPVWAVTTTQSDPTFGRFRLSSAGNLGYSGHAPDGEIEDHPIVIDEPTAASWEILDPVRRNRSSPHQ